MRDHDELEAVIKQTTNRLSQRQADEALDEALDQAILKGMERAKQKARRQSVVRKRVTAYVALACSIVLLFAVIVKASPVLAAIVKDIPGLRYFVQFIERDSGLTDAIDSEFVQPVGVTVERDGLKLTVEGVIADDQRIVLLYEVTNLPSDKTPAMARLKHVKDGEGDDIVGSYAYGAGDLKWLVKKSKPGVYYDIIDIRLIAGQKTPDRLDISGEWTVPGANESNESKRVQLDASFPIDTSKFAGMTEVLTLGNTIDIEGQKVTFEKATISPLNIDIEVTFDPTNAKQIFGVSGFKLTDEKGKELIYTGGFGPSGNRTNLHFQSNYFSRPKKLTLHGGTIYVYDKDPERRKVVIDTERLQILQAPDGRLKAEGFSTTASDDYDDLLLSLNDLDETHMQFVGYAILEPTFVDASGVTHQMAEPKGPHSPFFFQTGYPAKVNRHVYLPKGLAAQPLTFRIAGYPNYIKQSFEVAIK